MRHAIYILISGFLLASAGEASATANVQITNITGDLSLPGWSIGDPAVSAHMDMCLYSTNTSPSTGYVVTISSPNGYNLVNGSNTIPYQLYWDDSGAGNIGSTNGTQLSNGTKLTGQLNASGLSPLCALGVTGPNARLNVKIAQASMQTALAGNYSSTITLLVSPN